ncbi:GntR family transcriptional regulator [Cytobacillus oceanisediminis]|uniref:GntR family transcriptional regulator n=1 Tax=Cytobacillus oceanisediminis TaxID=665099 RepID=UPI003736F006
MKQTLNLQVFDDLFNKIKTNYYALGEKLPTESEMQKIYGVSRAPIRQALGRLQSEGLIERRPGIGSVVINNGLSGPWPSMGGFSSNFSKKWNQLRCKTIDVSKVIAEEDVTKSLELEAETPTIKVIRIRIDNNVPTFLLIHHYVDVDIEKIKNAGEILHMRQFASEVLGVEFAYVTEEIAAVQADEQTSYYLEVEKGFPLLQIKRISFDSDYKPVEYVKYFVRSEDWPYKIMYSKDGGEMDL